MRRILSVIIIIAMLGVDIVQAAEVIWDNNLAWGNNTATVMGTKTGDRVTVGIYEGDVLKNASSKIATGDATEIEFNYNGGDYARVFSWNKDSLSPNEIYSGRLTPDGVMDDAIYSDNQQSNRTTDVVGYRVFDEISGDYVISFDLTVVEKGDNAILLGDSENGTLTYNNSSAILLFNGDNFAVRNGNGNGSYTAAAVNLCSVEDRKTYTISFKGNALANQYVVSISDGENEYVSDVISARMTAEKIDTIAFVSNGKNTVVQNGCYSGFNFYGKDLTIETENLNPLGVYDGFEGMFYAVEVDGKYIRGNNGKVTADYAAVADDSAKFFVKNMGDGSYALVCKSSNNRMTISDTDNGNLRSMAYNPHDDSQHWVLEESENYSKSNLSYYMKHIETGKYIVKSGNGLVLKDDEKSEFVFSALKEESVLYNISKTEAYNSLSDRAQFMIESVYSSVAGDMFGRYGGYTDWTPKIRMDNMFNEILSGDFTVEEQKTKLNEFLNDTNGFIYSGQVTYETISLTLPGSVGCYLEVGEGVEGTYDFWMGTMLAGMKYPVTIYNKDGEQEQTLTVYVQNHSTAQHTYEMFLQAIIQIPYAYRTRLKNVKIRNDGANSFNGGGNDIYVRLNWQIDRGGMRSTLVHELGHILDQGCGNWASGGGWSSAIAKDMFTPSTYGASNNAEDFAEFCRMYFACYNVRDMQRGLAIIMPERYASFGRLRKNNMNGWGLWEDEYTK